MKVRPRARGEVQHPGPAAVVPTKGVQEAKQAHGERFLLCRVNLPRPQVDCLGRPRIGRIREVPSMLGVVSVLGRRDDAIQAPGCEEGTDKRLREQNGLADRVMDAGILGLEVMRNCHYIPRFCRNPAALAALAGW